MSLATFRHGVLLSPLSMSFLTRMSESERGGPPIMRHASPSMNPFPDGGGRGRSLAPTRRALISSGIAVAAISHTLHSVSKAEENEGNEGREEGEGGTRTNSRGERALRGHLIAVRAGRRGGRAAVPLYPANHRSSLARSRS